MEKSSKKVALITGANKGLGLEIARQLGQQGIAVVLGARQGKAEAPAAELRAQGLDARAVELDVTNASDIAALPAFFENTFGRLDIVVNNAGVQLDTGFDSSPDLLRQAARQALTRGLATKPQLKEVENALEPYGGIKG